MITIVDGDILNATENIICHQANCIGVMGGGLALQIAQRYPRALAEYKVACAMFGENLLGKITAHVIGREKYIVNLYGQYGLGSGLQTNYGALGNALLELKRRAKNSDFSIAMPYMIGCGLGGGDWWLVVGILEKIFDDYDVTLYKLNP